MVGKTLVVCASGPSLRAAQVQLAVDAGVGVIACSDAVRITGDRAIALVAADAAWWKAHAEFRLIDIPKWTAAPSWQGLSDCIERVDNAPSGVNSALLGCIVAVNYGATRILLLGVDLHSPGDHFFGLHPESLRASTAQRFEVFKKQFSQFSPRGVEIVNCSPGSALSAYPRGDIAALLAESSAVAA